MIIKFETEGMLYILDPVHIAKVSVAKEAKYITFYGPRAEALLQVGPGRAIDIPWEECLRIYNHYILWLRDN